MKASKTFHVRVNTESDPLNRFTPHHKYENAVCKELDAEETAQELSVSPPDGRDVQLGAPLPVAVRKEARQPYYIDSSCIFRISQDILFSSAMAHSSITPPIIGATLDKATYASSSYFRMKKMELSINGYFVDPGVFMRAFPGELESSSVTICIKNVTDLMELKLAKLGFDEPRSWWHSILNTLDAPIEELEKTDNETVESNNRWQSIDSRLCDELEEKDPEIFKDKCMIEVYIAKYIERLGIQDSTAPLLVPLRGLNLLASTADSTPQISHTDFIAPEPGWSSFKDSRGNMVQAFGESPELINITVMFSGEQPFVIRIWPRSHIANNTADVKTRYNLISSIPSRLVVVPAMSILVLRGDVGHAAASGQEMRFGMNGYPLTEALYGKYEHFVFNKKLPSGKKVNIRGHMYMPRSGGRIHNALFSLSRTFDGSSTTFPFKCNDSNMPEGHVPNETGY